MNTTQAASALPGNNSAVIVSTSEVSFIRSIKDLQVGSDTDSRGTLTFLFVTKGKIQLDMNKAIITGKKNDLIVCPPNLVLSNSKMSNNFDCKVLMLSNKFLLTIINNERIKWSTVFSQKHHPVVHLDDEMVHLLSQYEKLLQAKAAMYHGRTYELSINNVVLSVLCDLSNYGEKMGYDTDHTTTIPVRQCDVLFKRLITLVNKTISSSQAPIRSIQYYATELNVSAKYLTHVCKTCSGQTAKELIDSVLINRIEYLLLRSDLSVKEIAMQLGFPDVSNFGRYVKAKVGTSPRAIRAKAGK